MTNIRSKWAVETINLDLGQTVRLIELPQDWAAQLICHQANAVHQRLGRNHRSQVVRVR